MSEKKSPIVGILLAVGIFIGIPALIYFGVGIAWLYTFTNSGGPSARQEVFIDENSYNENQIIESLDKIMLAHNLERRNLNQVEPKRFPYYETAIWYSLPRTEFWGFGVGLVKWLPTMEGAPDYRYIVSIYSENKPCNLCSDTINALKNDNILFQND